MKKIFKGKYTIADPSGFKSKLRKVHEQDRAYRLERKNSDASKWSQSVLTGDVTSGLGLTISQATGQDTKEADVDFEYQDDQDELEH